MLAERSACRRKSDAVERHRDRLPRQLRAGRRLPGVCRHRFDRRLHRRRRQLPPRRRPRRGARRRRRRLLDRARSAAPHLAREDEAPGRWRDSPMARAVFDHVGGRTGPVSRASSSTARNAAKSASWRWPSPPAPAGPGRHGDPAEAGRELGRLANALMRASAAPGGAGGRAAELHPSIAASMRASLPGNTQRHPRDARPPRRRPPGRCRRRHDLIT
jgi:hypothetical protein